VVKHDPNAAASAAASPMPAMASEPPRKIIDLPPGANVRPAQNAVAPVPILQRLDQEKRILFTRAETQAIDRLVNNLAVRLNAQVKVSHVVRALTTLLLYAEGEIDKRAAEHGALTRPPNGDFGALHRFEREIAGLLASALRDAGTPR